jgi:hypothetical protein
VLTQDGEQRFVVVERAPRGGLTDEEASESVREARMVATLEHPNVVRIRSISVRNDEIDIANDYVAGERLSELWSHPAGSAKALPIEIALRILVDLATGLGTLHKQRNDEGHERVKFVHGEVTDENVLVGLDGVSLVLRAARVRRPNVAPLAKNARAMAPEVREGAAIDQRADVYSLGALLWQALSGRPFLPSDDVDAMLASAKGGTLARAAVSRGAPWALPLADVVARALAPLPEKRFPTASSMVTEVRKIAGAKLATEVEVARFVQAAAGEKIAARLADVQASAVIRKATSIPAPRSIPALPLTTGEKKAATREPRTTSIPPLPVVTTPVEPPTLAATPVEPSIPSIPVEPPVKATAEGTAASAPAVKATVEGTAPSALAPNASVPPPIPSKVPSPPEAPPAAATPIQLPPKRAAVEGRALKKTAAAVPAQVPIPSPLARPALRWAMGASIALILLTAGFALRALRNRQPIVTPGATPLLTPTVSAPIAPDPPPETAKAAPAPRAVPRAEPTSAPAATSSAKAAVAKPTAPRKTPPANSSPPRSIPQRH